MATHAQNALSIVTALLNRAPTNAERDRLLAAFGSAEHFVITMRQFAIARVKDTESGPALAATMQQIEADFTPTP